MSPQKHQNRKHQRKIDYLSAIDKKYYIFCEGQQTEPLYFDAFKKAIKIVKPLDFTCLLTIHLF